MQINIIETPKKTKLHDIICDNIVVWHATAVHFVLKHQRLLQEFAFVQ